MRIFLSSKMCILLGLVICFACQWTPSSDSIVENYWLKGDTLLIRVSDGFGWRLDIYREGHGNIRYGRHPNNKVAFENLDLSFDALLRHLARNKQKEYKPQLRQARITYLISGIEIEHTELLNDAELGKELFEIAFEASLNGRDNLRSKRRMLKMFKTNPPFGK